MNPRWRAALQRELVRRRGPHGLVGPATWLARGASAREHRALWWAALPAVPRPLYLLLEAALWLRWVAWSAWVASVRVARAQSPGEPRRQLLGLVRLAALALGWGVAPQQAVRMGVDRGRVGVLDIVYEQEADAWHRRRNGSPADAAAARLLRDKTAFAAAATRAGLPAVPPLPVVAQAGPAGFLAAAGGHRALFCKRRDGSGGVGAFAAWRDGAADAWHGRRADGRPLDDLAAVEHAWAALAAVGEILVQPLLRDAPEVAVWHGATGGRVGEVATIRVVTRRDASGHVACVAAWLELRASVAAAWLLCPIDPVDGRWRLPDEPLAGAATHAAMAALRQACGGEGRIPAWHAIAAGSSEAHHLLGGLWAVAWDWVSTPDGPRLLEGNERWTLLPLQRAVGGLLAPAS